MRFVRLALVTSVICIFPPVSFHISQESIVPNKASPLAGDWFGPREREKGGGRGSVINIIEVPVLGETLIYYRVKSFLYAAKGSKCRVNQHRCPHIFSVL